MPTIRTRIYHCRFNWYGEIHALYRRAMSERQCLVFCCRELAKILNREFDGIYKHFLHTPKSWDAKIMQGTEQFQGHPGEERMGEDL